MCGKLFTPSFSFKPSLILVLCSLVSGFLRVWKAFHPSFSLRSTTEPLPMTISPKWPSLYCGHICVPVEKFALILNSLQWSVNSACRVADVARFDCNTDELRRLLAFALF